MVLADIEPFRKCNAAHSATLRIDAQSEERKYTQNRLKGNFGVFLPRIGGDVMRKDDDDYGHRKTI